MDKNPKTPKNTPEQPSLDPETGKPYPPMRMDRFTWSPGDVEILTPAKPVPTK